MLNWLGGGGANQHFQRPWVLLFYCASSGTCAYYTVFTGIIEPHARTLELPLLVRSGSFFFFSCPKPGLRGPVFAVRSPPLSKRGNSRRLSVGFNYSSKYGTHSGFCPRSIQIYDIEHTDQIQWQICPNTPQRMVSTFYNKQDFAE